MFICLVTRSYRKMMRRETEELKDRPTKAKCNTVWNYISFLPRLCLCVLLHIYYVFLFEWKCLTYEWPWRFLECGMKSKYLLKFNDNEFRMFKNFETDTNSVVPNITLLFSEGIPLLLVTFFN